VTRRDRFTVLAYAVLVLVWIFVINHLVSIGASR